MSEIKKSTGTSANAVKGNSKKSSSLFAVLVVPICAIVAFGLFYGVFKQQFGPDGHTPTNFMGNMYQGGIVVPFLITTFLVCLCIILERFSTVISAKGKYSGAELVKKVQYHLANKNVDAAIAECDKQKGSVGNVLKQGLLKYKEMTTNTELTTEQKIMSINKEVEEASGLEMPMLEKNLVFLSTIASVATLVGLLGTVIGMIKSFSAMANAGAPDAAALAAGISEALYNTALGIGTSAFAIIAYNILTTQIDGITYAIDESSLTLTQSFYANYK